MSGRRAIEGRAKPDILDCIASLSNDEVFTPPALARKMLALLPDEVWTNPELRWLDPATKSGVFLREIARKLMDTLGDAIPDEDERREHIYKNMLYGLPTTELTSMISRRSLYYTKDADHEQYSVVRMGSEHGNIPWVDVVHTFSGGSCGLCGSPESLERGETRANYAYPFIHPEQLPKEKFPMKFDVIVGNPPYQVGDDGHGASASPLYHRFVEAAIDMDPRHLLMIVPSRWFSGGRDLGKFRARMLSDKRLRSIVDYADATDCFPGVDIQSGVNYFLWDREHNGQCDFSVMSGGRVQSRRLRDLAEYDVFVRSNDSLDILEKVASAGGPTLDALIRPQRPFGLDSNFSKHHENESAGSVKLYMRNGATAWVERKHLVRNPNLADAHKVFLPRAYGERGAGPYFVLGKPFVVGPATACTQTYLAAGSFDNAVEAENLAKYLRTKMVRFLVSLRKGTQDTSSDKFAFVPALDMNITWTDELLYARYSLTLDEIAFIESQIKEMP